MRSLVLRATIKIQRTASSRSISGSQRLMSAEEKVEDARKKSEQKSSQPDSPISSGAEKKKSQTELDAELREKMQSLAGDGGEAGLELEDGKPVTMKRGVRENMFRYI